MIPSIALRVLNLFKNVQQIVNAMPQKRTIKIIAAAKTQSVGALKEAYDAGICHFGENYVQEFQKKWEVIQSWTVRPSLVFIGHLQLNKVKFIIGKAQMIQSVDQLKLIKKIETESHKQNVITDLLIQINIGEEITKSGVLPTKLKSFMQSIPTSSWFRVQGFMVLPPYFEDPEKARPFFRKTKELFDDMKGKYPDFSELSMGTSHDYQVAIEEGATQIRIGKALFCPKK